MFWYNVISHNSSYYFKMYISEITKKKDSENSWFFEKINKFIKLSPDSSSKRGDNPNQQNQK